MPNKNRKMNWFLWSGIFLGVLIVVFVILYIVDTRKIKVENTSTGADNQAVTNTGGIMPENSGRSATGSTESSTNGSDAAVTAPVNPDSAASSSTTGTTVTPSTTDYSGVTNSNFDER